MRTRHLANAVKREGQLLGRLVAGAAAGAVASIPPLLALALLVSATLDRLDRDIAERLGAWVRARPPLETVLQGVEAVTAAHSFCLLWRAGSRRLAGWAVTTMAMGGVVNVGLREVVRRAGPSAFDPDASAAGSTLPSAHAQSSMVGVAVLLLIVLPLLGRRGKMLTSVGATFVVVVSGVDRVGLGEQTSSDVIAGWMAAVAVVAGTTMAFGRRPAWAATRGIDPVASKRLSYRPSAPVQQHSAPRPDIPALLTELRSLVWRLLLGAAVVTGSLLCLGLLILALDAVLWPLTSEESLVQWLEDQRTPSRNVSTHWMSWIGGTRQIITGMASAAVVFRLLFRRWREGTFVVAAVTMQALAFFITQALVARSRPAVEQLDVSPPTASYPSGHAGAALALFGSIALVLAWHSRRTWLRTALWVLLLIPPALVGYARVYRGMHFPSDVAGALLNASLSIAFAASTVLFAPLPPQLSDILGTCSRRGRDLPPSAPDSYRRSSLNR